MWSQLLKKSRDAAPRQAAARAVIQAPRPSLSLPALELLTPAGHLKSAYPHIWERIWLFCHDPAHLNKYLVSLSLQERDGKRAGLSPEAMAEVAEILAANQRFLAPPPAGRAWDAAALMR
ncbi:MAG: hypothetical protein V4693_19030 [Pseudomonadota bacterium]